MRPHPSRSPPPVARSIRTPARGSSAAARGISGRRRLEDVSFGVRGVELGVGSGLVVVGAGAGAGARLVEEVDVGGCAGIV